MWHLQLLHLILMVDDPCQNNEYGNVKMLHVQTSAVKFSQYTAVKYNISQQLSRGRALVDTTENTWQHKSLAIISTTCTVCTPILSTLILQLLSLNSSDSLPKCSDYKFPIFCHYNQLWIVRILVEHYSPSKHVRKTINTASRKQLCTCMQNSDDGCCNTAGFLKARHLSLSLSLSLSREPLPFAVVT